MCQTPDWSLGDKYLRENAPELAPLVEKYAPCPLKAKPQAEYFGILLTGIISQQLPPEVSQELLQKLTALTGKPITPEAILKLTVEDYLAIGLKQQKIDYLYGFAQAVVDGKINMGKFAEMSDSQITKLLLTVRGLGQWTIEMFLLLGLCRPDVVPSADYIFKKELQQLLNLYELPKRGVINKVTEPWRPWRSLVVWYLWQHANEK
ncbi:MAG: DNA-3-methyladenine glycosylase family protein [Phascolarctobacterium sp.]